MTIKKSINSISMATESNNTETTSTPTGARKRALSDLIDEDDDGILDVDYEDFSQLDEEKEGEEVEYYNNNSEPMASSRSPEREELPESLQYSYTRCMEELTRIENSQAPAAKPEATQKEDLNQIESPESPLFPPSQLLATDIPDLPSEIDTLYTATESVLEEELNLESQPPQQIPVDEALPQTQPLPAEILSQDFDNHKNLLGRIRYITSSGETKFVPINLGSVVLVGRQPRCQIRINDPTISSEQLTIKTSTGSTGPQVLCYNMGNNPTEINGVKLERNSCFELTDKSTIILNHTIILQYRIRKDLRVTPIEVTNDTRYTIENATIGVGAYGKVSRARDNISGKIVAVKTIKKVAYRNNKATDRKDKIQAEIDIMKPLDHPNVLNVLGVEEDEETIRIFLPYVAGGDLFGYITSQPDYHIPEDRARFIFWQLVKALQYLHKNQICHRDIKPENILIHNPCDYPKVVLCDFGMAKKYNMEGMKSVLGTWNYSAPEIVENLFASLNASDSQSALAKRKKTDYSYKVDSWSMGVLLFAMLSGTLPFYVDDTNTIDSQRKLFRLILRGQFNMNQIPKHNTSSQCDNIIQQLLCLNPSERLDMLQAESHSWIKPHVPRLNDIFEQGTQAEASAGPQVLSQSQNF